MTKQFDGSRQAALVAMRDEGRECYWGCDSKELWSFSPAGQPKRLFNSTWLPCDDFFAKNHDTGWSIVPRKRVIKQEAWTRVYTGDVGLNVNRIYDTEEEMRASVPQFDDCKFVRVTLTAEVEE